MSRFGARSTDIGLANDPDALAAFFRTFRTIVLVANSDDVDLHSLPGSGDDQTLYVFFNKVYKVLDRPFDRPCILVARSSPAGANIVYRREVDRVLRYFESDTFFGILNLRAGEAERFSAVHEFGGAPTGFLDLAGRFQGFYPSTHVCTSGFALALFLVEACPEIEVTLAGFTARRSAQWKLFADHDWTFEQIVLRLLARSGKLEFAGGVDINPLAAIAARFPEIEPSEISFVAGEVLSERLENAHLGIDRLHALTRTQRALEAWARRLKPKTRKQRLAEAADRGSG